MEFMEVILQRRSCREFLADPVSEEIVRDILEAARLAPTPGNGQNCYYGVIRDQQRKEALAKAAGDQMWIASAPVVIAYCASLEVDLRDLPADDFGLIVNQTRFGDELINYLNQYADRKLIGKFWVNGSPLIPGEHVFLTAVNHGLRACWIGYLDTEEAARILNLPDDMICLFLMPIGYAAKEPQEIERKRFEEVVFYESWKINDN